MYMYSKYREQDLKNTSCLERVPDYRGFQTTEGSV